jgi:carbonic anhydrase
VVDSAELERQATKWDYGHIPQWNLVPGSECNQTGDQSPIDILSNEVRESPSLKRLKLNNPVGKVDVEYEINGSTWEALFRKHSNISIEWNGTVYHLLQFHIHAPSENTVDGKCHDMEAHLVHRSEHGESLVLAQFFDVEESVPNAYFSEFWEDFPDQLGIYSEDVRIDSPYKLLTDDMWRSYYTWTGSLTTPPCTTGLTWILGQTSGHISQEQLNQFRDNLAEIHPNQEVFKPGYVPPGVDPAVWDSYDGLDNRPLQPIGNRVIYTYSELAEPGVPEASWGGGATPALHLEATSEPLPVR